MTVYAKVTSEGQITIPPEVRTKLGLFPGDQVRLDDAPDGRVSLSKADTSFASLVGILKSDVRLTDEELRQAIEDAREAMALGLDRD